MKLFKDIVIGENFVLANGQQLVRVKPETDQPYNCLNYPFMDKPFFIFDETQCLSVDELMSDSEEAE